MQRKMTRHSDLVSIFFFLFRPNFHFFQSIKNINLTSEKVNFFEIIILPWTVSPNKDHEILDFNNFQIYLRHFKITLKFGGNYNKISKLIPCLPAPNNFIQKNAYIFFHILFHLKKFSSKHFTLQLSGPILKFTWSVEISELSQKK